MTANLRIEATLPYDSVDGLTSGGDFPVGLYEFHSELTEIYAGGTCSNLASEGYKITNGGSGLPAEPSYIETLEQYFVWVCWQAELSLLSPLPSQLLPITVDFFEESTPNATIKVVANIPIDYEAYKDCENLVCSCLPLSSQISPAGLRSFSWEEITGKPTFEDVAFSGDYSDLTNTPSIPSSLDELNRFNELIRTINNTAPDPVTGNVDLTLDVGSVDWANITGKPTFSTVATSGNYNDLSNTPSIPVLDWANITSKPTFSTVATSGDYNDLSNTPSIPVLDWANIIGKPSWHAVAFSGSYNDLTDKPTIPESSGGSDRPFLGKKVISAITNQTLNYVDETSLNGIIDWIGTNENTEAYTNVLTSGKVMVTNVLSNVFPERLFDKNTSTSSNGSEPNINYIIDFNNYEVNPSKLVVTFSTSTASQSCIYEIEGSNDNTNWTILGSITYSGNTIQYNVVDLVDNGFFKYIRFNFVSKTGSITVAVRQIEFWGEVRVSSNVPDGSLTYNLQLSDLNYLLEPEISIGTINLLPLSTTSLNVGDRFYVHNPHVLDLTGVPASGDSLSSSNGLDILSQGQTAEIVKASPLEWFAF
ncbi:MAG: discoidin domain-containing protein [Crocosphaera sp.]|nr:discoidin domain-containing protein [Crocosphaera sp.]